MKNLIPILFSLLIFSSCGKKAEQKYRDIHNALFETFYSLEGISEEDHTLAIKTRDHLYERFEKSADFKTLWGILFKLKNLTDIKKAEKIYREITFETEKLEELDSWNTFWVDEFLESKKTKGKNPSFDQLNLGERKLLISLLINSKINLHRRIGLSLRNLYLYETFKELNKKNVDLREFVAEENSHLTLNKTTSVLEGELDYIVIGNTPQGIYLSHQLVKAGKKVLLLGGNSYDFSMLGSFFSDNDGSLTFLSTEIEDSPSIVLPPKKFLDNYTNEWELPFKSEEILSRASKVIESFTVIENENPPLSFFENGLDEHFSKFPISMEQKFNSRGVLYEAATFGKFPLTYLEFGRVSDLVKTSSGVKGVVFQINRSFSSFNRLHKNVYGWDLADGKNVRVFAKNVILASGALSTNLILQNSFKKEGLGNKLGANPKVYVAGEFENEMDSSFSGSMTNIFHTDSLLGLTISNVKTPNYYPAILFQDFEFTNSNFYSTYSNKHALLKVSLMETQQEENRVFIGKNGVPMVKHYLTDMDKQTLAYGVSEAARLLFKAGAKKVFFQSYEYAHTEGEFSPSNLITDINQVDNIETHLNFIENKTLLLAGQLSGGVRLNNIEDDGLVDENFKFKGTDNLFVVDESLLPKSLGLYAPSFNLAMAKLFLEKIIK